MLLPRLYNDNNVHLSLPASPRAPQKVSITEYVAFNEEVDGLRAQRNELGDKLKTLSQVRAE